MLVPIVLCYRSNRQQRKKKFTMESITSNMASVDICQTLGELLDFLELSHFRIGEFRGLFIPIYNGKFREFSKFQILCASCVQGSLGSNPGFRGLFSPRWQRDISIQFGLYYYVLHIVTSTYL